VHRLQEAIQVAKEMGEGLGEGPVLQREVQEGKLQGMISIILDDCAVLP
jgi:hypothetical protein